MTGMLIWRPHLGTLANSIIILAMMGWLCLLWYRYRSRYTAKRTVLLLAPKLLLTVLALTALMDPAWRNVRPTDDSQKVAVISDISTSMDVEDDGSKSRAVRARQTRRGRSLWKREDTPLSARRNNTARDGLRACVQARHARGVPVG